MIEYHYLGRRYVGGGLDSENNRSYDFEEDYELSRVEDLPSFLACLSPAGQLVHFFPPFRIKTSKVTRVTDPKPDGKVILTIAVHCSTCGNGDYYEFDLNGNPVTENTPPWLWRARNIQLVSTGESEHATRVWPVGETSPQPFVNTAGVPLEAEVSRGLSLLSFTYYLEEIDPDLAWKASFRTNDAAVTLLDLDFPERHLLIQGMKVQPMTDRNPNAAIRWKYVRVDLQILIDPDGFDKDYLNVGTSIRTVGGLARLWSWNNGTAFGSYQACQNANADDGEEVSDPLFLDDSGMFVSSFVNGRQQETCLRGCVHRPMDFSLLRVPLVR